MKRRCDTCRFWSEMLAQMTGFDIEAICLGDDSPHKGQWRREGHACDQWQDGSLGSVDDPGGNPYA